MASGKSVGHAWLAEWSLTAEVGHASVSFASGKFQISPFATKGSNGEISRETEIGIYEAFLQVKTSQHMKTMAINGA
jgi:hypothetical protein